MPNFSACLRSSYRDVQGRVLSCTREGIEEDPFYPGHVRRWRNKAPGIPSLPEVRSPGDVVTYPGGRFGDPEQANLAYQPQIATTLGGQQRVLFENVGYLNVTIPGLLPDSPRGLTAAFQFERGSSALAGQAIFEDAGGAMHLMRSNGSGDSQMQIGGTGATVAGDLASGTYLVHSDGNGTNRSFNNAAEIATVGSNPALFSPGQATIGADSGGDYLRGYIDALHIWARDVSPLERDFIWHSVNEDGVSYSSAPRATVVNKLWTDVTGNPLIDNQIVRVRSSFDAPQYFKLVTVTGGGATRQRVQIAASVAGLVLPDSMLNGDLFTLDWIETPGKPRDLPVVTQDAGWSAVFDCGLKLAGHYCAVVRRNNGGGVVLHFDVKVVP